MSLNPSAYLHYSNSNRCQTRSGKTFASWGGDHVTVSNPKFNFDRLLQEAIDRDESNESDSSDHDSASEDEDGEEEVKSSQPNPGDRCEPKNAGTPPLSSKARRRARIKSQSHSHRANQRRQLQNESFSHHTRQSTTYDKYISTAKPILTPMSTSNAPVTKSGFVGRDDRTRSRGQYRLEDVVGEASTFKFRLQTWDGRHAHFPTPSPNPKKN